MHARAVIIGGGVVGAFGFMRCKAMYVTVSSTLDPEDAQLACAVGADTIVVSNHGVRQLDGAPSTISVLPQIVAAVDGRCEVLLDGGIQSGQDVTKAFALGTRACLIGRAFLYGLAAMPPWWSGACLRRSRSFAASSRSLWRLLVLMT